MAVQKIRRIPFAGLNAGGDNQVVPAIPAQSSPEGRILQQARKIRVMSGLIVPDAAGNVTIMSGLGGSASAQSGAIPLAISEKFVIPPPFDWELGAFETKPGEALNFFTSIAMSLDGYLVIAEVV
jgi:hypothetical protein